MLKVRTAVVNGTFNKDHTTAERWARRPFRPCPWRRGSFWPEVTKRFSDTHETVMPHESPQVMEARNPCDLSDRATRAVGSRAACQLLLCSSS
jgi:hypothetical protein